MKKFLSILFALLLTVSALTACETSDAGSSNVTINVYNWGQYIADGSDGSMNLNREFTKRTGIKVNYVTFDSNESMYSKLKAGGSSYDVIIPSDYMIERLISEDMLEKLDFSNIPNFETINESLKNPAYDPQNEYSVPYTWGTVGIIYNKKYVTKEVKGWDILWDKDYAGKILMFDNPRDSFAIAESLLGFDVNDATDDQLRQAADKLKEQRPLVQNYVMDQIFEQMEYEEAWIAPYYAGDFLTMQEVNEDLAFCFPEEGFNLFADAACIPKGAKNKKEAEMYINFLCDPEISAENCEFLGYSTPSEKAKEYMDADLVENEIAYPPEEILSLGYQFKNLSVEQLRAMDELWLEVKAG